jgi:hypothetical protein
LQHGPLAVCLFCKGSTETSFSIEHIVPESLGNVDFVLPAGVVCDKCNNYFARKLEGSILACGAFLEHRFAGCLPNKSGRVPTVQWTAFPSGIELAMARESGGATRLGPIHGEEASPYRHIVEARRPLTIVRPAAMWPARTLMSRFIGKVALEALAHRVLKVPGGLEEIVTKTELDELRRFVRFNVCPGEWPIHERQLYDMEEDDGHGVAGSRIIHELMFLYTPPGELYFVIAIFGREYAINMGGPEIDGLLSWFSDNDNRSPLYLPDSQADVRYFD